MKIDETVVPKSNYTERLSHKKLKTPEAQALFLDASVNAAGQQHKRKVRGEVEVTSKLLREERHKMTCFRCNDKTDELTNGMSITGCV